MSDDRSKQDHSVPVSPPGEEADAGAIPIVQPPVVTDIAFYTIGDDTRHFDGMVANTISDVYRRMAEALAPGHVHGVQTRQDAIQTITTLPVGTCICRVYFVGHGWHHDTGTSGYFFSGTGIQGGQPLPLDDFHVTSWDQTASDTTCQPLISAIGGRACQGITLSIDFLCCYAGGSAGGGDLLRAVETELGGTSVSRYRIAGTPHEFRFEADENRSTGELTNWQNHLRDHSTGQDIPDTPDPLSPHRGIIPGNLRVIEPPLP